ncbi:hypothetical protein XPA_006426 [Xanthoria parietina]
MASPCLRCLRQGCTGGTIERLRPMTVCTSSINSSTFKDCPSSNCPPLGCIAIPPSFTFKAHGFVRDAIKALESGEDFTSTQRTAIRRFYTEIYKTMKNIPFDLLRDGPALRIDNVVHCPGTGSTPFHTFLERDSAISGWVNRIQSVSAMKEYSSYSYEELRLADYNQGRRYGILSGQASERASTPSTVAVVLEPLARRLGHAEQAILELQCENASLKVSAVTVERKLAGLESRLQPSSSLQSQMTTFNGFNPMAGPSNPKATMSTTPGNSLFSKGFPPSTPAPNASLFTPAASTSLFSPAPSAPLFTPAASASLFSPTPSTSLSSPAPSTPSLFGSTPRPLSFSPGFSTSQHTPSSNPSSLFNTAPTGISSTQTINAPPQVNPAAPIGSFNNLTGKLTPNPAFTTAPQPSSTTHSVPPFGSTSTGGSLPTPPSNSAAGGKTSPGLFDDFFGDK